ncbi:MAG: lytic transglycosylase domain-containing protein [Bdellovibrionales bacterium]|nr:lytic transglycosylase domain-containing protein [Bdellovibrionales bacterium]
MKTIIRYKYHLVAATVLSALILMSARTTVTKVSETVLDLPRIETDGQLGHAMELFRRAGFSYLLTEGYSVDQRAFVLSTVKKALPAKYKDRAFEVARAVIIEANHHNMDPLFLLAVIKTESKFDLKARGRHGEIGLMQILPRTAAWLAPQAGVSAKFDLEDPATNIRIGATYFAQLRKTFNGKATKYVGAYNMGPTNVRRLAAANVEPAIYPSKVLGYYKGFYKSFSKVVISASLQMDADRSPATLHD